MMRRLTCVSLILLLFLTACSPSPQRVTTVYVTTTSTPTYVMATPTPTVVLTATATPTAAVSPTPTGRYSGTLIVTEKGEVIEVHPLGRVRPFKGRFSGTMGILGEGIFVKESERGGFSDYGVGLLGIATGEVFTVTLTTTEGNVWEIYLTTILLPIGTATLLPGVGKYREYQVSFDAYQRGTKNWLWGMQGAMVLPRDKYNETGVYITVSTEELISMLRAARGYQIHLYQLWIGVDDYEKLKDYLRKIHTEEISYTEEEIEIVIEMLRNTKGLLGGPNSPLENVNLVIEEGWEKLPPNSYLGISSVTILPGLP